MNGLQRLYRIGGLRDRSSDHEIARSLPQCIGRSDDAGLIVLAGSGRANSRRDQAKVLCNLAAGPCCSRGDSQLPVAGAGSFPAGPCALAFDQCYAGLNAWPLRAARIA